MSYCKYGDQPRVDYTLNGQKKTYYSTVAPIDVNVESKETDINRYTYFDPNLEYYNNQPGTRVYEGDSYTTEFLDYCLNGQTAIRIYSNGVEVGYSCYQPGTLQITPINTNSECTLTIKHNNNTIFTDKGKCPINFTVACGRCPDNHVECKCDAYPGYCCIPCSEIKGGIISATAMLRGINRG